MSVPSKWFNLLCPCVHVNVDASFVNIETKSSCVGVIRDKQGEWCLGFHSLSHASNSLHAELMTICQGLHVGSEANYIYVALHSNCKQAIDLTNNMNDIHDDFCSDIVMDCRSCDIIFKR